MSKIALSGNASGTGTLTIAAPNTSTDRTLTLPDNTGTLVSTGSTAGVTQAMLASNVAGNGPAFSAYSNSGQSIPQGTLTKILFQTERFDTNNNFDSTTNNRFTPTVAGYYFICATVTVSNAVNNVGIYGSIFKNGSSYAISSTTGNVNLYPSLTVSSLIYFNGSTDYVEVYTASYNQVVTIAGSIFGTGDGTTFSGYLARAA